MTLLVSGQERTFAVVGTYSDVTNGGKTAKACFQDDMADVMWYVTGIAVHNPAIIPDKVVEYSNRFNYAKVSDVGDYVSQTFGSTTKAIRAAAHASTAVALGIACLITLLFMKMLIAKDRYPIAVMKALGFTNQDIRNQYTARSAVVFALGIVISVAFASTLGEWLTGALISSMGVAAFSFVVNPWQAFVLCPLTLLCAVLIGTATGTSGAGSMTIAKNIKE